MTTTTMTEQIPTLMTTGGIRPSGTRVTWSRTAPRYYDVDNDNDGVPDGEDPDDDNNGVSDAVQELLCFVGEEQSMGS